ncbi:MAG TPA: hypothetical protein VM243_05830 [Phycisphaerae bacterium]|nr:hypothetical protein [Phycisphaerae bacterium]
MSGEELFAQIERDERWLRSVGVEVEPPPDLGAVKRRVRIAIDECWLDERGVRVPSATALAGVKRRVRQELAAGRPEHRMAAKAAGPGTGRMPYPVSRTLAAAAALALAAGLGFWSAVSSPDGPAVAADLDDLAAVMGRDFDDEEVEWEAIEMELAELEATLVQGADPGWEDEALDELFDEMDELSNDVGLSPGVS